MNLFRLEKDLFPPHPTDFCMKYVTGRKKPALHTESRFMDMPQRPVQYFQP